MSTFFKAFIYAFRGIKLMILKDRNFKFHISALVAVICLGFYFNISKGEWALLTLTSMVVLALEAVNATIEKVCDEMTLERKESIRNIKDIAAGAVLIAAIGAVVIGCLIFGRYVF